MANIVGHERVISILDRSVHQGRPAHAYLFTGREGIGKKRVAIRFACQLNCPDPDSDLDGTCQVCRRIANGNHPDVTIESPERGIIRIDRVRNLQNYLRYAPIEGKFKVTIIDDAHTMNPSAQNALLKTLEEPPACRILILVTSKPFRLLSTVRSRSRCIRFAPLSEDEVVRILQDNTDIPSQQAAILASMSGGSVARSLEMNDAGFLELREHMLSILTNPNAVGIAGIVEMSATLSSDRRRAADAIEAAVTWLRDQVVRMLGNDPYDQLHNDSVDETAISSDQFNARTLLSVYNELLSASELIEADINANLNLIIDVMLLRITRILAGPTFGVTRVNS